MANDFSGDANCVALWNFDNGALTTDSKGGNTLTDNNTVGTDGADYKQGDQAADLNAATDESFSITDGNLDAGFPLKAGDAAKLMSFCFWFKPETLSGVRALAGKWEGLATYQWLFYMSETSLLFITTKDGEGTPNESETYGTALQTGRWYHVGVAHDGTGSGGSGSLLIRIWDDTAGDFLGTDIDTSLTDITWTTSASPFYIGAYGDDPTNSADGKFDEFVMFKDLLTAAEIDQIRAGTYGAAAGWAHKFNGVMSPGKGNGIVNANIGKINGVAV